MQVTIHTAKTNLSKLIEAALAGEEVVIAKGQRLVARIVPIPHRAFKIGLLAGQLTGGSPGLLQAAGRGRADSFGKVGE